MKIAVGITIFIALIGLGVFIYSQTDSTPPSWQEHDDELAGLESLMSDVAKEIQAAAGEGLCRDSSQCRAVGLGALACGHYTSYLLYSQADVTESHLLGLVDKFNQASEKFARLSLKVANCGAPAKAVQCLNQKCVVVQ